MVMDYCWKQIQYDIGSKKKTSLLVNMTQQREGKKQRKQNKTVCCTYETVLFTRLHPAHPVFVPILPPGEVQALWSQNHDTEKIHRIAVRTSG